MGRRAHLPEASQRRQVEAMAGYGVLELVSPRERLLAELERLAQTQTGELTADFDQKDPS